ncbi:hypothetical protein SKAU_G00254360 [Synaphobranchus kaupii]|uniref:Peptidase M14 domain-containing protein n=1 Tax=Synaphobranchus kaupii TaxID=118154 RepID=A0A9Q1F3P9_SYNKA|nr:hypothetical protein SKAU_G00254360 [Synaphobranchus kaupii]
MAMMLGSAGLLLMALCMQSSDGASYRAVENGQQDLRLKNYNYTKYHPMDEISLWMEQVQNENPGLVSSEVYGKTYEGKNITLLKIGLASSSPKKAIWMDCGIHAREWIAPAFCQWFVKEILQTYKADEQLNLMLKNVDIYVTPVLNIDGYMYSWTNESTRLWRKSRSPSPEADCSCYGTDLNRNFNANWGTVGISRDCCSQVYCGPKPLSETEALAVTESLAPNYYELMQVGLAAAKAMKAVHGMEYIVGTSPDVLYPNSGSSRDWARLIGIPFSFTFELRDKGEYGFKLPEDQIQPACEEAYAGARSIMNYVHDKAFNITTTTAPTTAPVTTPSAATATAALWTVLLACSITSAALL